MQNIIVLLIIATAATLVFLRFRKIHKKGGCGCGCGDNGNKPIKVQKIEDILKKP